MCVVAAACIIASHPQCHAAEFDDPPYRVKRLLRGCWTKDVPPKAGRRWGSSATICFMEGRTIGGGYVDAGHGGDFCERYRVDGRRLVMRDNYGNAEQCLYHVAEDRNSLILGDCRRAGEWKRDGQFTLHGWPCRTQEEVEAGDD